MKTGITRHIIIRISLFLTLVLALNMGASAQAQASEPVGGNPLTDGNEMEASEQKIEPIPIKVESLLESPIVREMKIIGPAKVGPNPPKRVQGLRILRVGKKEIKHQNE